ncbi:MAG: class I SAM-dependent methyltransferase [Phycisphaeraceae bacterium]|nr:class I SAM-dependent methyltransferase [Phycisphaeraceae bacterium]
MTRIPFDERLAREVEYFEKHYADEAARGIAPLSDFDRRRYANPKATTSYPREFYYHLLAPLAGKQVMEIASGNGIDASLCATHGAEVFAYDISSESIGMVRRRAQVNGIADRVHTQVTGLFDQAFAGQTFDHIIGYAALHHIPLEGLAERIYHRLKPGGSAVFAEPVINSHTLHALRRCIPYYFWQPTEDEKPLDDAQIALLAKPFPRMVRREFQMVSRLWPAFPGCWPLVATVHHLDKALLKLPFLRRFATVVVFALHRDA